jgi:hypothetical protein
LKKHRLVLFSVSISLDGKLFGVVSHFFFGASGYNARRLSDRNNQRKKE